MPRTEPPPTPADLTLTAHAAAGVALLDQARALGVPHHTAAVELALLADTPTRSPDDGPHPDQTAGPVPDWLDVSPIELGLEDDAHGQ